MSSPVIVITGTPVWAEQVEAQLSAAYRIKHYTERTGFVTRLTDWRAAMILVDASEEDWHFWVSTPKSSPATRRIPIVVAAEEAATRRAAFNAGNYYRQHDLFEAQWMKTEGPVRDLYRAILQVGIAYYQIERGNHRGALKMLLRSVQWLLILPDVCQGVDVRQLREDSFRVRAELEAIQPEDIAQFDRSLLTPVRMAAKD